VPRLHHLERWLPPSRSSSRSRAWCVVCVVWCVCGECVPVTYRKQIIRHLRPRVGTGVPLHGARDDTGCTCTRRHWGAHARDDTCTRRLWVYMHATTLGVHARVCTRRHWHVAPCSHSAHAQRTHLSPCEPCEPCAPSEPSEPCEPYKPCESCKPSKPYKPSKHYKPCEPCGLSEADKRCEPCESCGPCESCEPFNPFPLQTLAACRRMVSGSI
jgi:hypothetical protein